MEDRLSKYLRLAGNMLLAFIIFVVCFTFVFLLLRWSFGLLDDISWFSLLYTLLIIIVPPALFITVYLIYFSRTRFHPSAPVRFVSYIIFSIALIAWGIFLVLDTKTFLKGGYSDIGKYYSYEMIFLVANVATIFFVGVMQALTQQKEKDWMERLK